MPIPRHRHRDLDGPDQDAHENACTGVIVPDPAALRQAVERYLGLVADGGPAADVPLQNAVFTLCVLTGTRTAEEAMATARRLCPEPAPRSPRQVLSAPPGTGGAGDREALR